MTQVLVVGAGLAGCTVARELADNGMRVILAEASDEIGGKVISYGCKASDKCNNCGVCLTAGLWEGVTSNSGIEVLLSTRLIDLAQDGGKYTATLKSAGKIKTIENLAKVVVSTGFEKSDLDSFNGFVELSNTDGIITGSQLESLFQERTVSELFETAPESVAFVQCYGSRDYREHSMYCSKVCCAYATRAAKAIKHFYPECRVVFFYMEMQMVNQGDYYQSLLDAGIEFIKCRPVSVTGGKPATITYDDPSSGKRVSDSFGMVVLSNGIRADSHARHISEICGLGQDTAGFLRYVSPDKPGVLLVGCASGPKKIDETYAESLAVAKGILRAQEVLI